MTAIRRRRTRATIVALVASLLGLVAALVLGLTGLNSLADSTAGQQAAGQAEAIPSQRLPVTATALVGVVDDAGRLTSVVVWVLEPDGVGGSIVGLAATADTASGTLDTLAPLAAVLGVSGPAAFRVAVERLTGLSFDVVEVLDQQRFAQLISPLGDIPVNFPITFSSASSGETWEAGDFALSAPAAARAITANEPAIADYFAESGRAAVWRAVAERVGAGIGSIAPIASDENVPIPRNLGEFSDRLFGGPVKFRALGFTPISPERVRGQLLAPYVGALGAVDAVVAHDRAEMIIVLGAVAPGRLGAPLDAPVFRVVSPFTDEDLADLDLNRSDVLKRAIDRLLFAQANVVSVADISDRAMPEVTQVVVADPSVIGAVTDVYRPLFGEIEVTAADVRIEGIDITVTLGRSFLEELRAETGPAVAGSVVDESVLDESVVDESTESSTDG